VLQAPKKRVAAVPAGVKKVCSMSSLPPPPPPPRRRATARPVVRVLLACETRETVGVHWQLSLNTHRVRHAQAPAATKTVNPLFEKRPKTFGARLAFQDNLSYQMVRRRRAWLMYITL